MWEGHPAKPFSETFLVLSLHALEMVRQVLSGRGGERRLPILVAFAGANEELVTGEIEILHTQAATFHRAQAASVHQHRHQPRPRFPASDTLRRFFHGLHVPAPH